MLAWIPSLFAALVSVAPNVALAWPVPQPQVTLGIDVLASERLDLLKGKKVGLLTHPAGVDGQWVPSVDRLVALGEDHDFKVVQLYGPEHGIRGFMSPGERGSAYDPHTKIPVESLFGLGKRGRPSPKSLDKIDVLFGGDPTGTSAAALAAVAREVPSSQVNVGDLGDVVELLVRVGLGSSKGDVRRTLEGGGYRSNGAVLTAGSNLTDQQLLHGRYLLLQRGRKSHHLVEVFS